jgi:hypothetical protein
MSVAQYNPSILALRSMTHTLQGILGLAGMYECKGACQYFVIRVIQIAIQKAVKLEPLPLLGRASGIDSSLAKYQAQMTFYY